MLVALWGGHDKSGALSINLYVVLARCLWLGIFTKGDQ